MSQVDASKINEYVVEGFDARTSATKVNSYVVEGSTLPIQAMKLNSYAVEGFTAQSLYASEVRSYVVEGPSVEPIQLSKLNLYVVEGPEAVEPQQLAVPTVKTELNPYRPDVPSEIEGQSRILFRFMREQAETLRLQHNKIQMGDSTYPFSVMTEYDLEPRYTLGVVGRFYTEDYGLIQARYVQFKRIVTTEFIGAPVGSFAIAESVDWIVTNDFSRSSPDLVQGVIAGYRTPVEDEYGWVIINGVNIQSISLAGRDSYDRGADVVWASNGQVRLSGEGRTLGYFWGTPFEGRILPGVFYINVNGAYGISGIRAALEADFGDLSDEISGLDVRLTALENASVPDVDTINAQIDAVYTALGVETTQRIIRDNQTNSRIDALATDFVSQSDYAIDEAAEDLRFDLIEAQTATIPGLVTSLAGLQSDFTNYVLSNDLAISGFSASIAALNLQKVDRSGDTMTGDLLVPDDAYAVTWDGNFAVPTKNAVYDKIESLAGADIEFVPAGDIAATDVQAAIEELDSEKAALAGAAFVGDITVPDEAYGVGWNGSVEVPTKNAVYDKIESLAAGDIANTPAGNIAAVTVQAALDELDTEKAALSGATFTGDVVVPDEAYGVGWDGSLEVPSKNSVYDKIESLAGVDITFTPAGDIAATDLQDAVEELDSEKVSKAGDTMTATLQINNGGVLTGAYPVAGITSFQLASNVIAGFLSVAPSTLFNAYGFSGGDINSMGAVPVNQVVFRNIGGGYDGTAIAAGVQIAFQATEGWTSTAHGMHITFHTTANGAALASERFRIAHDGSLQMGGANTVITSTRHPQLRSYTVATLPSAATAAQLIYVSDGTSNKRLAVSDGANWRWPDGAIVS